jgi:hypothetical protein
MVRLPLIALCFFVANAAPVVVGAPPSHEDRPTRIGWQELVPRERFEDPFTKLSREQLQQLGEVARMSHLLANEKVKEDAPSVAQAVETAEALRVSGVDVDYLLMMRRQVGRMREAHGRAAVERFNGVEVALEGFVVPTQFTDGLVTEFFLVPEYDFCSFGVSLPPNQVVLVRPSNGFATKGTLLTATVVGQLKVEATKRTLFQKNGPREVEAAYVLSSSDVDIQKVRLRSSGGRVDVSRKLVESQLD